MSFCHAQLLLNEFMIDPDNETSGEFIEIFNGSPDSIFPGDYFLCDAQDTDRILNFPTSILPPGKYGIILDPDYSGEYDAYFPDSLYKFTISDSKFGKYGISNSSSKPFSILDSTLSVCDTYTTGTAGFPGNGKSCERIYYYEPLWTASEFGLGTPGFKNSCFPQEYDLSLSLLSTKELSTENKLLYSIKNNGVQIISSFCLKIYWGFSPTPGFRDTVITVTDCQLERNDSVDIGITIPHVLYGACPVHTHLSTDVDTYPHNNCSDCITYSHIPKKSIILTEFLCKTGENNPVEYYEYQSLTDSLISLQFSHIFDLTGESIISDTLLLQPNSQIILTQSDQFHHCYPHVDNFLIMDNWLSLNNSEDKIVLAENNGNILSEIHYDENWNIQTDQAHELISILLDPQEKSHWISTENGSPGERSSFSISLENLALLSGSAPYIYPKPDTLCFTNTGLLGLPPLEVLLTLNNTRTTLNLPRSQPGDTFSCPINISTHLFEGMNRGMISYPEVLSLPADSFISFKSYASSPLFLNEILISPDADKSQSEFLEIYSQTSPLNTQWWTLSINDRIIEFPPELFSQYSIFTADPDFTYNLDISKPQHTLTLPAFPNDGFIFLIRDPAGKICDSVNFNFIDLPNKGISLEKRYENCLSTSPQQWCTSLSPTGTSPGVRNSVSPFPGDTSDFTLSPEIFDSQLHSFLRFSFHEPDGLVMISIKIYDLAGYQIADLSQSTFSQQDPVIIWKPETPSGSLLPKGMYPAIIKETSLTGEHKSLKILIIIYQ